MAEEYIKVATERRQRRERDAEAAREAIINAAQSVFVRCGYSGARVDEIAKESGYNKALIFHYFQDKLGLYQEVVGRLKMHSFSQLKQNMSILIPDESVPLTRQVVSDFFTKAVRLTFDTYQQHPDTRRLMSWEAAEGWPTFVTCHPEMPDPTLLMDKVRNFIQRAQEGGFVRQDLDPASFTTNVMGMALIFLVSIPRYQQFFPQADFTSPEGLHRVREQMAALAMYGAMTPEASSQLDTHLSKVTSHKSTSTQSSETPAETETQDAIRL